MNKIKATLALLAFASLLLVPAEQAYAARSANTSLLKTDLLDLNAYLLTTEVYQEAPAAAPAPAPKKNTKKKQRASKTNKHKRSRQHQGTRSRRTASGRGFSYERMEVASSTPSLIKTIIDHGQELLGLRYRTSGIAKWPLDCSGFVSYIYSLEGIKTPRSSSDLSVYTDRITDPKPGDLLFFKGRNRGANRVGHVAMVVSNENGDIKMMHSSNSRGIVIESLNSSPYFSSRYLGAGRLPEVKEYWKEAAPVAPSSLD